MRDSEGELRGKKGFGSVGRKPLFNNDRGKNDRESIERFRWFGKSKLVFNLQDKLRNRS